MVRSCIACNYPCFNIQLFCFSSGDTGASAYLRLSGKPPFKVVYQQKRNGEATKEMTKTFFSSRGEIVFQPESSGNYSYELLYLSDANYARRKLHLPAFNTVVHPLASASFASQDLQGVGTKRTINSCSGEFVDVDLDLRVSTSDRTQKTFLDTA